MYVTRMIQNKDKLHKIFGNVKLSVPTVKEIQRNATACIHLFTAKLLYMFRASIAPKPVLILSRLRKLVPQIV